ncbi:hypothetical protein [Paenarthrobacter sp. TA1.8]|uniref:hypothetical protein n=1 Tax=Paenarthrobacter sp. TA1.8 TaxID=3400219 RepID=UPI003B439E25
MTSQDDRDRNADKDLWKDLLNPRYSVPEDVTTGLKGRAKRQAARSFKKESRMEGVQARTAWMKENANGEETDPRAVLVVLGILVALIAAGFFFGPRLFGGGSNGTAAPAATDTVTATATPTATASPTTIYFDGNGPQAPAQPTFTQKSLQPVDIAAPTNPAVDTANAESVATSWAKAYHSRANDTDDAWKGFIAPYTVPDLMEVLTNTGFSEEPLKGKEPTQVPAVKVSPAEQGTAVDTPVRWSRTLEVEVQSKDGSSVLVDYAVALYKGENGWNVTDAVQKAWTIK